MAGTDSQQLLRWIFVWPMCRRFRSIVLGGGVDDTRYSESSARQRPGTKTDQTRTDSDTTAKTAKIRLLLQQKIHSGNATDLCETLLQS